MTIRSVLVAFEPSANVELALNKLADLLERLDPNVELLGLAHPGSASGLEAQLREGASRLSATGLEVGVRVMVGDPTACLLERAAEARPALIVVLGVPALGAFRAQAPLLLLPLDEEPLRLGKVAVALGEEASSAACVAPTAALCQGSGSDVYLLHHAPGGVRPAHVEAARRRLEAFGSSTLLLRRNVDGGAPWAELADADLVAVSDPRSPLVRQSFQRGVPVLVGSQPARGGHALSA